MPSQFEYRIEGNGDDLALHVKLNSASAKALVRLDRYINWEEVLKQAQGDPEATHVAERLHTVLQHMGR